jgi:hypothetical protein
MKLLAVLLGIAGVILGVYVGLWLLFIGGIVEIIDGVKLTPVDAGMVGWGIVKLLSAELVGYLIFITFIAAAIKSWTWGDKLARPAYSRRGGKSNRQVEWEWERLQKSSFDD